MVSLTGSSSLFYSQLGNMFLGGVGLIAPLALVSLILGFLIFLGRK